MTRIIIAPSGRGAPRLEVEQSAFDNGFYPGYVYVSDATPAASSEASAEEQRVAGFVTGGTVLPAALRAAFVSPLPTSGSFTYNSDGTVASDPDGNTYTWNADGTPHTQTKGGVTRTYTWNADGTLASVA